jgi:uncharacterized membrane protein
LDQERSPQLAPDKTSAQKPATPGKVPVTTQPGNPGKQQNPTQTKTQTPQNPTQNPTQRQQQRLQHTQTQPQAQTPQIPQQQMQQPQTQPQATMNPAMMQKPVQTPAIQPNYQVPQTQIPIMPQPQTQTGLMPAPAQQQQIIKPTSGKCSVCNQNNLIFFDNGMGKCLFCGRTFDWLNPKRKRLEERQQKLAREQNPFMVTEDEILDESERKAEVEAEDVIHHDAASSIIGGKNKAKDEKKESEPNSGLSDEKRLELLEDRLISGEISEEIYTKLRDKFAAKLLESLEDKLVLGEISEDKYNEIKQKYA